MPPADQPRRSPLHDRHLALGARMAGFGGWQMPLQYTGVVEEHTAVRERAGLFDVSHLGKATVTGSGARALVDACLTNDLGRIGPGRAQYTLCCEDRTGGIVDDLLVYLRADHDLLLVPNAVNCAEVVARLAAAAAAVPGVGVADRHGDLAILAVQGPRSDAVLHAVGLPAGHAYMSFVEAAWPPGAGVAGRASAGGAAVPVTVCRSGYTGERGYELVVPWESAGMLWDALLGAGRPLGLLPAGLGARDTLRTEMGYPLHGQDIGPDVTPVQAGSSWAVGWSKPAFWGREVLLAERAAGPRRRLRGLRALGRAIPRPGMVVSAGPGQDVVGRVTSGTYAPTLRRGIGLALLDAVVAEGEQVSVDVRGRAEPFEVVRPPFVPASTG